MADWQDMIVGDRMTVDGEFASRVDDSRFSRQEWGLVMTATSFEIENPGNADAATLVADTTELPGIVPELENVAKMGGMGQPQPQDDGDGLFGSLMSSLGFGGGDDDTDEEKLRAAERLVDEYAQELQAHLEAEGRWEEVRTAAAESTDG